MIIMIFSVTNCTEEAYWRDTKEKVLYWRETKPFDWRSSSSC